MRDDGAQVVARAMIGFGGDAGVEQRGDECHRQRPREEDGEGVNPQADHRPL